MKNIGRRILCLLFVASMLLSMVAVPGMNAQATEEQSEWVGHDLFDYNYTCFAGGGNVQAISDADAYQGNAKIYTGLNLDQTTIPLYRYEANNPEHQYGFLKLGEVAKEDLKVDQGYQAYSFTTTLPAEGMLTNGNYVYFTDGCTIQNATMAKDLKTLAGKTVTITMSMKITGQLSSATVYVDRMQIKDSCEDHLSADGTYCTACGKSMVDTSLPTELQTVDTTHIDRYNYADFDASAGGAIVEDTDSPIGQAFSHTMSVASGIDIYRYAPSGADYAHQYMELAKIPAAGLAVNDGYHFYKSTVTVPEDIADPGSYVYVNWYCRNTALCNDLIAYAGKTVDFYISMKITGTDLASIQVYVDQMIVASHCEDYQEGNACSLCGKVLSEPETTEPETTEPETTEPFGSHDLFDYNHTSFAGGANVQQVSDADAYQETAKIYTGVNLDKASVPLYRYEANNPEHQYGFLKLGAIAREDFKVDQGYQTYSFTTTIPAEGLLSDGNYVYLTDDCVIQNAQMAKDIKTLAGKTVTITMSMKITGQLSSATVYVDRMQIQDSCEDNLSEDGTYCTVCGKSMVDTSLPEDVQTVDPQHIIRYNYADFDASAGGAIVEDADSPIGQTFSHTMSVASGIDIYRYAPDGADLAHQYMELAKIPAADLKINDGYHFYKSTVTVPDDIADPGSYVYVNWFCRNTALCNDLVAYAGKTVDFYISMKITGTDLANVQVDIDQMILVDLCENHNVDNTCSVCGKVLSGTEPTEPETTAPEVTEPETTEPETTEPETTEPETTEPETTEPETTEPLAHHVLFDYNYTHFSGSEDVQNIRDADAYMGTAKVFTGVNLDKASIPLYRYEPGNPEFRYEYLKLGAIAKEEFKVDQGYQTYSIKTTLPAEGMLSDGNTVYFTDNWTIKNAQMAKDLKTLAGKTVAITISMKITGELGSATVYVDRMQIKDFCEDHVSEDGTHCTVCGKNMVEIYLPEELESVDAQHIHGYNHSKFSASAGGAIVEDADSPIGQAFSHTISVKNGIEIYRYAQSGADFAHQYLELAKIPAADIVMNDGYHFYKSTVNIPADITDPGSFVYVNWHCRNTALCNDLTAYAGKTVDFFISMKVTGEDPENAQVFIDQMILVDRCENYNVDDVCSVCGKDLSAVQPTEPTEPGPTEPQKSHVLFDYNHTSFAGGAEPQDVADTDAYQGTAKVYTGVNLDKASIPLYRYEAGNPLHTYGFFKLGAITKEALKVNQGYHTYSFTKTIPAEGLLTNGNYVYLTDDCTIQNAVMAKDLKTLAGKTVTITMSMKITGELANATVYVDRMQIMDSCVDHPNADGTHCTVCGGELPSIEPTVPETVPVAGPTEPLAPHELFAYDFNNFAGSADAQVVGDRDAYRDIAMVFTGVNLDKPSVPLYRYEKGNPVFSYEYLKLGAIARESFRLDQGYQTYSITTTIPAEGLLTDGNHVYFTDGWTIQNAQMAKDLKTLAGKTVTITMSMKITGELANATVYVDRMQIMDSCVDHPNADGTHCTVCGGELPSIEPTVPETVPVAGPTEPLAPHELFAYDFNNFAGSADAQAVGDRDAYRGIAMVFTGVNLDKPSVPLYRYEKGNPVFSYEYLKLGAIARESFRLDQGYQTYSITTTIPAEGLLTDGNHVYFTDNWTIQNAQMAKDLKTLAGKTVAITMSMKITGSLSNATVYVDRMQIKDFCEDHLSADETHCTVCGKNMAQISLPDELKDVDSQHIQGYNYSKFSVSAGGAIVEDADSPIGQAFSHTMSVKSGIEIYRYAQSGADFSHQYLELAKIPAANIVMNDGYHFYRSTVTVPEDIVNPGSFVYVNWHCRNTALCDDLAAYAGKTVDFFISMKVTGEDPENAQVFIDQMILVDRCENYNVDDVCSVCGKSVSGIITNPVSHDLFDYNHTNFAGGGNVQEIADADAYQGTAKIYTGLNLDKPSIPLYRYEAGNPEFEYGYLWLGAIARADLIVDQGYYTYSFTTTIPEEGLLTDGNYVYLTDECTIQNAQMARNLKALAGKTVTIKLSMKIVGPLSNATVYVDRMQILESCTDFASEDGTTCTKCGKPIVPEEEALPIPEIVDFVYTADDFTLALSETNGDCVMEDSTSAQGKAAVLSYKARMEKDNSVKDLIRTDSQTLKLYIYGGDPAQSRLIHEFTVDQLKENAAGGKYVEYTVRDIDLIPTNDNYYFYMFDSWCFKLNLPTTHQRAIHKQGYVDVTISMKITGDVTGKGTPPAYYIDKIAIKAAESGKVIHRHEYKEWTAEQLTHSATCLSCGETTTQFHKWDAGVVTKEYTGGEKGERLYTCTVCGATKTEQFDNRVRLVFHADSFHLPSKGDSIVKDSSAPHGMAALFSTANRLASGSSIKDLQRKDAQRLSIYSYGGNPKESRLIGELDVNYLEKTIWSGKYITYKFKGADAFPTAGTYFLYMFDGWGFQIPLNQSQVNSMIGKTMDLFLTIKVTGDLTGYVNYYIDEVILQETSSEGDHLIPDVPKRKIPRVIDSLPAEYFAEDFRLPLADFGSGDVVVEDPTSAYGKAVMLSYESRKAYDGEGKSMIREPGKLLRLYTDTAILIGEWTSAQLQENAAGGEYVLYEFKNVNLTGAKFMYMFDCWGFQIPMEKLTDALSGVNVDVKVSMKVTGDVTSREENTPAYYIDYISITESAPIPEHEHVYENWITDVLNHKAACTVCGIRLEGFHVWDDGVVTKEATATEDGEIVYTCKICKMEDVKKIKKKPNAAVEEPEPENHGILIGVVAAGLIAIVIAVVAVLLLVKKPNKPSKTTEKPTQEEHDETT